MDGLAVLAERLQEMETPIELFGRALAAQRDDDVGFERAWFLGMRVIHAPRTATDGARGHVEECRALLHEAKPFFRAAYEGGEPDGEELAKVQILVHRRWRREFRRAAAVSDVAA